MDGVCSFEHPTYTKLLGVDIILYPNGVIVVWSVGIEYNVILCQV